MKKLLVSVFIFSISLLVFSQENDTESWNAINLSYKINKKWDAELETQLRLKEDISTIDKYFAEAGLSYAIFKGFKIGVGARYIKVNDNVGNKQGYEDHFMYIFDLTYKHKIKDFSLKYRARFQNKNELGVSESEGDYANKYFRFKTAIAYDIKNWKFDPKFAAEIFNHQEEKDIYGFNKYRLTLGTEYEFNKKSSLSAYYRIQQGINQVVNTTTRIIGLKFSYKIN